MYNALIIASQILKSAENIFFNIKYDNLPICITYILSGVLMDRCIRE